MRRTTAKATMMICASCAVVACSSAARAQNAQGIKDNHFSLEIFEGPVLAPIGVTGIAGAYAGYAEGIAGFVANAASPAVREPFSTSWFDFDVSASVSLPIKLFSNDDFDNSGTLDYDYSNFVYVTLGGLVQVGPYGVGVNAEWQRYSLTDNAGATTDVLLGRYHALAAWSLLGHQIMLGGGARLASLGIAGGGTNLTMFGAAPEFGVLVRPDWQPFRVGATFRSPVSAARFFGDTTTDTRGVERAGPLIVPDHVSLPWEIEAGIVVQVGPRPLNPKWIDAHEQEEHAGAKLDEKEKKKLKEARRDRYANWPREHLLLSAEILVTGATDRGVGLEGFLGQNQALTQAKASTPGSFGASTSYSPRVGIETEPVPDFIHTRLGSYWEPSRYDKVGRQHFTFGADVKLFPTTWWGLVDRLFYKAQASIDLAPRYQSMSFGLGVWH